MRILVFGAGAMGSLIGGYLARNHEVTLVARRPHVEAIRREGLLIRGREELRAHPRAVESAAEVDPPEVVVVTVKSYQTEAAAEALRPFWRDATFLSLQNGLGNVEVLARGAERVMGGVTYHGVTFLRPGEILHAGEGETLFGPVQGVGGPEAERIAAAFRECGLRATVSEEVATVLWTKAVVNACFNPLTALLRARSGALDASERLRECCAMIVHEATAVARGQGVALDAEALLARVRGVARATAGNRSSMLQDLENGRRTEIDAINGAIARMGAEQGIDCPTNRLLALLVSAAGEVGSA